MAVTDLIAPGVSWDGTVSWEGRTVPTESGVLIGSDFEEKVIANWDEPPFMWFEAADGDKEITVVCDHGDASWIDEVEFWLEGSTVTVSTQTKSARTGAIGFSCMLDASAFAQDGDCQLYATVRPVNGYERLIGPLDITANPGGTIARTVQTVKTSGGDYTGIQAAVRTAPSGAIIKVDAGTWLCDDNTGAINSVARMITVQPADGLSLGDVVLTRAARDTASGELKLQVSKVEFKEIEFDQSTFIYLAMAGVCVLNASVMIDSNGVTGPTYGYYAGQTNQAITSAISYGATHKFYALECTLLGYCVSGFILERNCTKTSGGDLTFLGSGTAANVASLNTTATLTGQFYQRLHLEDTVTVASVAYNTPTAGKTTITLSGSPTLRSPVYPALDMWVVFLTGALADSSFLIVSQDNDADTIVVTGDASAAVSGDTCWSKQLWHADGLQVYGAGFDNNIFQRYKVSGIDIQPLFLSVGSTQNFHNCAIQCCIFDQPGESTAASHLAKPLMYKHLVIRQTTHVGCDLWMEVNEADARFAGSVIRDCVIEKMSLLSGTFPSTGLLVDNNHFESGTARGSNTDTGDVTFDANYRATAGLTKTMTPTILWDYAGNPLAGDGSDLVGAMGADPVSAPTVTTDEASDSINGSAVLGGEVTDDGGDTVTDCGIVWNTTGTPTTSDNKVSIGSGTGTFSDTVSGLSLGTIYARAYATNSAGTSYGSEVTFENETFVATVAADGDTLTLSWTRGSAWGGTPVVNGLLTATLTVAGTPRALTIDGLTATMDGTDTAILTITLLSRVKTGQTVTVAVDALALVFGESYSSEVPAGTSVTNNSEQTILASPTLLSPTFLDYGFLN